MCNISTYLWFFNRIEERIRDTMKLKIQCTKIFTVYTDTFICFYCLWMRILSNHEYPIKVHLLSKTVGYFLRLLYLLSTFNIYIYRDYFQKHNHKPLTDLVFAHGAGTPAACSTSSRASGQLKQLGVSPLLCQSRGSHRDQTSDSTGTIVPRHTSLQTLQTLSDQWSWWRWG